MKDSNGAGVQLEWLACLISDDQTAASSTVVSVYYSYFIRAKGCALGYAKRI